MGLFVWERGRESKYVCVWGGGVLRDREGTRVSRKGEGDFKGGCMKEEGRKTQEKKHRARNAERDREEEQQSTRE